MKNRVLLKYTLEEYNIKYRKVLPKLLKISQKEVDYYDQTHPSKDILKPTKSILGHRKWWLIDDTYYEIPRVLGWRWFLNLHGLIKTGTILVVLGAITCAVVLPLTVFKDNIVVTDYKSAKEWVNQNYSKDTNVVAVPKKSVSNWSIGGYVVDLDTSGDKLKWCTGHIQGLIKNLTHLDDTTIEWSKVGSSTLSKNEFGLVTSKDQISGSNKWDKENSYYKLTSNNFDLSLNSFYGGLSKYNATYTINKTKKTLTVNSVLHYNAFDATGNGYHNLIIPNFSLTYDNLGRVSNFKLSNNNSSLCNYAWYSEEKAEYSSDFQFVLYAESEINVNLVY